MRRSFKLPLKPFSVNQMFYGRRDQKTAAYRDWETLFLCELGKSEPQQALSDLRNAFKIDEHCYRMRIVWYSPHFWTAEGKLSSKTFDVTNVEKPIVDLLCLPKYHVQSAPWGCKNLNIDDKHVVSLTSGKRCSTTDAWQLSVDIWLEKLEKYRKNI